MSNECEYLPSAFAFDSRLLVSTPGAPVLCLDVLTSSFTVSGQTFQCIPTQLVPYGEGYTNGVNQGCAIAGAAPGSTTLNGDVYLDVALRLYRSHLWRNFGIVVSSAVDSRYKYSAH